MIAPVGRVGIDISIFYQAFMHLLGTTSTAVFMLKGENYPFQVMVKNNDFVLSFGRFGESCIRVSLIPLKSLSVQCTI